MRRTALILLLVVVVAGGLLWWTRTSPPPAEPPPVVPPPSNAQVVPPPPSTAREVTLFFARQESSAGSTGWVLVPVRRPIDPSASVAQASLEALVAGPTVEERASGIVATLPAGTQVLGIQREGGVITANFSRELQENFSGGAEWEEVVLYSIVNTLTEVEGTDSVRIRIDGAPVESIGGHLAADEALRRNNEIVAHGNQR